jgi:hypothetical protein
MRPNGLRRGWHVGYVWGREGGEEYLEVLAQHRMTNDRHFRLFASGRHETLPVAVSVTWTCTCYCMCMRLDRRLQLLLDEARYLRVAAVAKERNTSVAAVIREAIDAAIPAEAERKKSAWREIQALPLVPLGDPDELRAELDEARGGGRE